MNLIQHAYDQDLHHLTLTILHAHDDIQIVIEDHDRKANAKGISAEAPKTSGLGFFIMENLMDTVAYTSRVGAGSTITLTKKLKKIKNSRPCRFECKRS